MAGSGNIGPDRTRRREQCSRPFHYRGGSRLGTAVEISFEARAARFQAVHGVSAERDRPQTAGFDRAFYRRSRIRFRPAIGLAGETDPGDDPDNTGDAAPDAWVDLVFENES